MLHSATVAVFSSPLRTRTCPGGEPRGAWGERARVGRVVTKKGGRVTKENGGAEAPSQTLPQATQKVEKQQEGNTGKKTQGRRR